MGDTICSTLIPDGCMSQIPSQEVFFILVYCEPLLVMGLLHDAGHGDTEVVHSTAHENQMMTSITARTDLNRVDGPITQASVP